MGAGYWDLGTWPDEERITTAMIGAISYILLNATIAGSSVLAPWLSMAMVCTPGTRPRQTQQIYQYLIQSLHSLSECIEPRIELSIEPVHPSSIHP